MKSAMALWASSHIPRPTATGAIPMLGSLTESHLALLESAYAEVEAGRPGLARAPLPSPPRQPSDTFRRALATWEAMTYLVRVGLFASTDTDGVYRLTPVGITAVESARRQAIAMMRGWRR